MAHIPEDLAAFLEEPHDSREYRRALAVKLALLGYLYASISEMLDVTPGFISQAKRAYVEYGVDGFTLKYHGTQPYLSPEARQSVIDWLKDQEEWSVALLQTHIEITYGIVFQSRQSYYQLLDEAKITYKKAQHTNPRYDAARVAAKKKKSLIF
jgi:putative transposase